MAGERLVSRLETLVERVEAAVGSSTPNAISGRNVIDESEDQHDNDVNSHLASLFPSVNSNSKRKQQSNSSVQKPPSTKDLWAPIRKRKSKQSAPETSSSKRAKKVYTTPAHASNSSSSSSTSEKQKKVFDVLKDVFFIPDPEIEDLPRKIARQLYYMNNLVGTAVRFSSEMDEVDINEAIKTSIPRFDADEFPSFIFVRAVDDLLVPVKGVTWSYKTIRHVYGQGPVYVRAIENQFVFDVDDSIDEDEFERISKRPVFSKSKTLHFSSDDESSGNEEKEVVKKEVVGVSQRYVQSSINKYFEMSPFIKYGINCPICNKKYPANQIEGHAANCEIEPDEFDVIVLDNTANETIPFEGSNEEIDVSADPSGDTETETETDCGEKIKTLLEEQREKDVQNLRIRRKYAWIDFINAMKKPWMKKTANIHVQYIDDSCIDTGGPKRDFFSTTLKQMAEKILSNGTPKANTMFLEKRFYYYAGWLVSMSFLQGGPSPTVFSEITYKFISSRTELCPSDYPLSEEFKASQIYTKLCSVNTDSEFQEVLQEDAMLDVLSRIGFWGVPSKTSLTDRTSIIQSVFHKECIEPILSALHQLAEGMCIGGLVELIKEHDRALKCYFVYDENQRISDSQIYELLKPNFTKDNLVKSEKETEVYKFLADALEYIHKSDCKIALEDVLQFLTGASSIPPLGFEKKIEVCFIHNCPTGCACRPTASTCSFSLHLPVHYKDENDFQSTFVSAIIECCGFGRV